MKWSCGLGCPDEIEFQNLEEVTDHLRLLHPEHYGDGPERWPDGQIVVYDTTLDSQDFTGEQP